MTTTCAWCRSRSIAADAISSSRKSGCHSSKARFDVMIIEPPPSALPQLGQLLYAEHVQLHERRPCGLGQLTWMDLSIPVDGFVR